MKASLDVVAGLLTSNQCSAVEFNWAMLRYQHVAAIRTALGERYASNTANKILSALRRVVKEAWRLGQIDAETYQRTCDVRNFKSEILPTGRALQGNEIAALMAICKGESLPVGIRDAAMLSLLRVGLRRSEVVKLDVDDLDLSVGKLLIRQAKGKKDRTAYLTAEGNAVIGDWVALRGREPGPLLRPISKSGRILSRRLTDQAVLDILQRLVKLAGIAECTPHDWRRTFAGDLLDGGADLVTVQKLMGHSSPETTSRYDRRGEEAKRRAVQSL